MDTQIQREDSQQVEVTAKKKSYLKPAFRCERVFETQALSCGKTVNSIINACSSSSKNS